MVAEMENYGAACHLEDGDGQIPASDQKGEHNALTESDISGSGTSSEESSEEDEDEEGDEEEDECSAEVCAEKDEDKEPREHHVEGSSNESTAGPEPGGSKGIDEMYVKPCCERCKAIPQSHGELVTPRRISKGRQQLFLVQLEGEGTYECSVTGLVFEVSEQVQLEYSVLSWSKFGTYLTDSWKFAGPIFNVDTVEKDASVLKSIQFPHTLCLAEPDEDMRFSVLHIKNKRPTIEPTVDHSGSHVKWNVSSLSPVGPIYSKCQTESVHDVPHHGVVLIYKERESSNNNSFSFRIYLATNNASEIKVIQKDVCGSNRRYMKIEKPPTCKLNGRTYRLMSDPVGEIVPEELDFTLDVVAKKGYFEAVFEQPPPFKLSLIETDTEQTVWFATIREGDCEDRAAKKPQKTTDRRLIGRKRSSSTSEEEFHSKRPRWPDESDGLRTAQRCQDISEKQLLQVAKRLGKEWKQVAIFLDLSTTELDDIQAAEKDVTMQKHKMLVLWKSRRQPGEATASNLRNSLNDLDDLPNEVHQILDTMDK